MSRNSRGIPEINAGSMADIAFLLLVFFLVTTTMDIPTGIQVALPPLIEDEPPPESPQREKEVLEVLVNANNQLLVEKRPMDISQLRQKTMDHLTNEGRDPNLSTTSTKAIVSLKNDRQTSYETYVRVYNELTAAYNIVRNNYAMQKFGRPYDKLNEDQLKEVKKKYPKKLSEAEPVNIGGEN